MVSVLFYYHVGNFHLFESCHQCRSVSQGVRNYYKYTYLNLDVFESHIITLVLFTEYARVFHHHTDVFS